MHDDLALARQGRVIDPVLLELRHEQLDVVLGVPGAYGSERELQELRQEQGRGEDADLYLYLADIDLADIDLDLHLDL